MSSLSCRGPRLKCAARTPLACTYPISSGFIPAGSSVFRYRAVNGIQCTVAAPGGAELDSEICYCPSMRSTCKQPPWFTYASVIAICGYKLSGSVPGAYTPRPHVTSAWEATRGPVFDNIWAPGHVATQA
eukprot:3316551-Prymnesium_polylepis.1